VKTLSRGASVCILAALILAGCHGSGKKLTQTFMKNGDSAQSLELSYESGFLSPENGVHDRLLFALFRPNLSGSYVQKGPKGTVHGRFEGNRDGDGRWLVFTAEDKAEWKAKIQGGRTLVDMDKTEWRSNTDPEAGGPDLVKVIK